MCRARRSASRGGLKPLTPWVGCSACEADDEAQLEACEAHPAACEGQLEALAQALALPLMQNEEDVQKECEAQLLKECEAACTSRSQPLLRGSLPAFQVRSQRLLRGPLLVADAYMASEAKEEPSWGQRLLGQRPLRNQHRGTI